MIDLHCHILPSKDDGPKSFEESIKMAEKAVSEGILTVVATPHHKNEKYLNEKSRIIESVNQLKRLLIEKEIPLEILPGQEPRIYGELLEDYRSDKILTLNNNHKYLLVELPSNQVPQYTDKLLYDIQTEGIIPVIVHPERNSRFIQDPNILYEFVNRGAITQVTASSLTGHFGKKIKKFAYELVENNLTHVIASDAHNLSGRDFRMKETFELVEKEWGREHLYIFNENANAIVNGKSCIKLQPELIKKKRFLGIL